MEEKYNILVVDDNESIRRTLSLILSNKGYETETAGTGREATEKARERFFNVGLLDIRLPDMEGLDLLGPLKDAHPDMVLIMVTGHASMETAVKALNQGASAYILKPLDMDQVLVTIRDSLEKQRLVIENRRLHEEAKRDLAELKRSEKELAEKERYFRSLLYNIHEDIVVIDRDYRITDLNNTAMITSGHKREDVIGRPCFWLFHGYDEPCDKHGEECRLTEVFETGKPASCQHVHRTHDCGEVHVDVLLSPLLDESGRVTHVIEAVRDVSEFVKAEEAVRESEEKYRLLVQNAPIGIISVDTEGRITEANEKMLAILGSPSAEATKSINVLTFPPLVEAGVSEKIKICMEENRPIEAEMPYTSKWGKQAHLRVLLRPMSDSRASALGCQAIVEDIGVRKSLEKQLRRAQKMESIGTLAGGIAHDFNNLLTIILGYSELSLLGKEEGDPGYQDLQTILQTTKRGADLVRQILTFSREVETQPRPISLNHEVEQAQKLLYKTISKMIEIQLFMAEDLKTINADPVQVEQVVMNLAVNSQHAMPDGGRLVFETKNVILDEEYCKTHLEAQPGEYVMLMVSDTGHGIEKEALEHIFEPFYSTKKPGEGTGLGLAMVHGIVKQNRGFINCYSEPGVGTTFKIYLPTLDLGTKSDVETSGVTPAFGTETILLVDDEELIRDLGQRHLSRAGYTVLTALNGQEALEIYERQRADISLVLLDLIMPEMGGRECLEELLRIDPQVKVLIASGFSVNGPTRDAIEGGARGFVSKPFDMKRLLQTVRKVLDES